MPDSLPQNPALSPPDPRRWLALAVILSATLLGVLDFLIVNIALPSIRKNLGATDAQVQLTVAVYGLAFAVCLITGGRLGDIYGRKRMFQIGMAGFTLASVWCGFAQNPSQLVLSRVVQGAFAALMSPQVLATIQVTFAGRERDTATGILGAVVGIGSFLGNVVGGWIVGANLFGLGWRPIFFVNVPIGITAVILAQILVRDSKSTHAQKLDIPGAIICAVALFLLIFPLAEGRQRGWPLWAFALMGLSGFVAWMFFRYQAALSKRGGAPLLDTELLRNKGFGRGLISLMLLYSGVSSFSMTLTLFLQDGLAVKPENVGRIFAALSLSFFISSLSAARLVGTLGPRVVLIGMAIMQVGQIALIALALRYGGTLNPYALIPVLFLYGLGQGLCLPQFMRRTLNHVTGPNAGAAAGVLSTTQQVAFTLGISVVGSVFFGVAEPRGEGSGTPDTYAHALAAAFCCNFVFVLITRLLVGHEVRTTPRTLPESPVPAQVVVEA